MIPLSNPALAFFTVPSSDRAFAEFVRRISERTTPMSPIDLQERLRRVYPRVLVRPRGLSSDDHIWYVYREGTWVDGKVSEWWYDEATPRLEIDRDGFITSANPAAAEAFGAPPSRLMHRHFTDFAVPGTLDDIILMREILLAVGEAGGTFTHLRADGEVRVAEYRSVTTESGTTVAIHPIGPTDTPPTTRPSVSVETRPVADRLFAVVVDGIVSRIPEPTPVGLEIRLRRSYPYASVDGSDPALWRVTRDPRPDPRPVDWEDPRLARTVALDTSLIIEANQPALELLGADLVGRHWHELALPASLEQRLQMRDYYVANGGAESTFRLIGATGALVDYDYRLTWQGDRFATIMARFAPDQTPAGYDDARLILNDDGTIADANEAALAIFGSSLETLQAAPRGTFAAKPDAPDAQAAFRAAWESQGHPDIVGEATINRLDGRQQRVMFGITRLSDGRLDAVLRSVDEPADAEPTLFTAGEVLARWRAAERELETIEPESSEASKLKRDIEQFRLAYQQVFVSSPDRALGT